MNRSTAYFIFKNTQGYWYFVSLVASDVEAYLTVHCLYLRFIIVWETIFKKHATNKKENINEALASSDLSGVRFFSFSLLTISLSQVNECMLYDIII